MMNPEMTHSSPSTSLSPLSLVNWKPRALLQFSVVNGLFAAVLLLHLVGVVSIPGPRDAIGIALGLATTAFVEYLVVVAYLERRYLESKPATQEMRNALISAASASNCEQAKEAARAVLSRRAAFTLWEYPLELKRIEALAALHKERVFMGSSPEPR